MVLYLQTLLAMFLPPLLTMFHLYHGSQLYWQRKQGTTVTQRPAVTNLFTKDIIQYILAMFCNNTPNLFCDNHFLGSRYISNYHKITATKVEFEDNKGTT